MKKIDEQSVAKKISLDLFTKRKVVIILIAIIALVVTGVLIWSFAFKGTLHTKLKNQVNDMYLNLVINRDENYCVEKNFTENGINDCRSLITNLDNLYDNEDQVFKYTTLTKTESVSSTGETPTFVITDISFKDQRVDVEYENKFMPTIWFIYKNIDDSYKINHLYFLNKDNPTINK